MLLLAVVFVGVASHVGSLVRLWRPGWAGVRTPFGSCTAWFVFSAAGGAGSVVVWAALRLPRDCRPKEVLKGVELRSSVGLTVAAAHFNPSSSSPRYRRATLDVRFGRRAWNRDLGLRVSLLAGPQHVTK